MTRKRLWVFMLALAAINGWAWFGWLVLAGLFFSILAEGVLPNERS